MADKMVENDASKGDEVTEKKSSEKKSKNGSGAGESGGAVLAQDEAGNMEKTPVNDPGTEEERAMESAVDDPTGEAAGEDEATDRPKDEVAGERNEDNVASNKDLILKSGTNGKGDGAVTRRYDNIIDLMPSSPEARKILEERALSLRTRDREDGLDEIGAKKGEPYIRFFLGPKKRFGILHIQTEKVVENAHVTRVPGVPDHIVGIMNYRGNLLTVLSLRSMLALGREESEEDKQIIVARINDLKVGFLVDSIEGEGRIVRESINVRDVSNMGGETRGIIGIADGTVAILDLEKLMSKPGVFVDMSA